MKLIVLIGLLINLAGVGCLPEQNFDDRLNPIVKPHLFDIAGWELEALPPEINQWAFGRQEGTEDKLSTVTEYFAIVEQITTLKSEIGTGDGKGNPSLVELARLQEQKTALTDSAERIIQKQIGNTLTEQGIFNPITKVKIVFPPLSFKLGKPPYLLVISPRDRIESWREITLKPDLTLEEITDIEAGADKLGVSSLVVELGGLGVTYPSLVNDEADLSSTINAVIEEWLHQYLAFKPLGFRYLLDLTGLAPNYEIATMNETLAGMVSKEIGEIVLKKYYPESKNRNAQPAAPESEFNFDREMRAIRKMVDRYLARGEIEQAEEFMIARQRYLAANGYNIRKLNQAYFAFHGTYADSPGSTSPIGPELKKLREQSSSVKDFLNTAAAMTSRQELIDYLSTK